MAILNRDQIKQAQDLKRETVAVPEWGGEVIVRGLSAAQRLVFSGKMAEFKDFDPNGNPDPETLLKLLRAQAEVACCAVVDEQGKCLFDINTDVEWLIEKSGTALERIFTTSLRLSGIDSKAGEEAVKNS